VAILAALPALTTVLRVPPVRVLRREAEPLPPRRGLAALLGAVLVAALWAMASAQAGSPLLGLRFTAVVVTATLALLAAATGLTRVLGRLPRFSRVWLRYGLASLARPGAATLGAVVALGLGVLVVLGMQQVESHLVRQLERDLPAGAPSSFLVDVQPDQWAGVRDLLVAEGAERLDSVPVVMARLAAIGGRPVGELAGEAPGDRGRRWALTREQRLTYLRELPADNRIVAGALWSDPAHLEVSVEEEFARDLGVGLGSVLRFDVQGVALELAVTSLRAVEWESFGINFFLVAEPGALEDAPQFRLAAARLPRGAEQRVQDLLAERFPNVTLLQVRDLLEKIAAVLRRIGLGVRLLGGFTVVAGVAILAGAVSAAAARRRGEVALLKTLGMTRAGVVGVLAAEQALVGLVAGAVGAAGAALLSWLVLSRDMELAWEFQPAAYGVAILGAALLATLAGTASSLDALRRRPLEVLRGE
jgi:putative ABC transport system permease protein